MNTNALKRTAVLRFESPEDGYVVESPLSDKIIGVGETPEEAWQVFEEVLAESFRLHQQGKFQLNIRPGRPRKGKTRLYADVKPEVKDDITALAKQLGVSSGEVVEYLHMLYQSQQAQKKQA